MGIDEVGLASVLALGDLGSPAAIDALIDLLGHENEDMSTAAREAMESILGSVPAPANEEGGGGPEDTETPGPEEVRAAWAGMASNYGGSQRWLRGRPLPWREAGGEEPMEALWRTSLLAARPEAPWLRNEVPDGFFVAGPGFEAVPGE